MASDGNELVKDTASLSSSGTPAVALQHNLAVVSALVNGQHHRPRDFLHHVTIPYGTASLLPHSNHNSGDEVLTIKLDLPGGFKYSLQFEGMLWW